MNFSYILSFFLRKLIYPLFAFLGQGFLFGFVILLGFMVYISMKYRVNWFRPSVPMILRMKRMHIKPKLLDFLRWKCIDALYYEKYRYMFREYGMTLFCGKQGSGKTISMIQFANWVHFRYPEVMIVANFNYKYAHAFMLSWQAFIDIRNDGKGVLFLIDEIHSEWSSAKSKDFPEDLLREVSQERKQKVKIAASAQIFTRVAKPLREQAKTVVVCSTIGGRWTRNREYDATDYEIYVDSANMKKKLRTRSKASFIQSDALRNCYDTYEKVKRMAKSGVNPTRQKPAA